MSWYDEMATEAERNPLRFIHEPRFVTELRAEEASARDSAEIAWWEEWWERNGDDADASGVRPPAFVPAIALPAGQVFNGLDMSPGWLEFFEYLAAEDRPDTENAAAAFNVLLGWLALRRAELYLPKEAVEVRASLFLIGEELLESTGIPGHAARIFQLAALVCEGAGQRKWAGKWAEMARKIT